MPTRRGAIRLFQLAGIDVYVHWAWFLAFIYLTSRPREYSSYGWNALEVLLLFLIVLIHEFGHQLACRSVGGQTSDIVLWPLGGVAYVSPPPRPGAQLWSIAAGPLVNVALMPILFGLVWWADNTNSTFLSDDGLHLIHDLQIMNLVLLVFNLLPIYPLDGGQILRSLLWFFCGRARSLLIASIIGFVGVAGLGGLALWWGSYWLGLLCVFNAMNCWGGFKQAQALDWLAKAPRREGFACPECHQIPPQGDLWRCGKCGTSFDIFGCSGVCPHCRTQFNITQCLECGATSKLESWTTPPGQ